MTTTEVFHEIVTRNQDVQGKKWYAGYMSPQAAFLFKKRFVSGKMKESTVLRWFAEFGYEMEVNWKKSEIQTPISDPT